MWVPPTKALQFAQHCRQASKAPHLQPHPRLLFPSLRWKWARLQNPPHSQGAPLTELLKPLTVLQPPLTHLAGERALYLQVFLFQLALGLFSDFVTKRVKARRILLLASKCGWLKDQRTKGQTAGTRFSPPVLHSPGLHRMKRQLRCFRPQGPSLQPQPPCPEFLLQHGCSLPITPPPPGSPPTSLTLSWRLRRAQQAFQAAPGGGSFLFPRAWVFLFWVCFLFLKPGSSICLMVKPKRITDFFFCKNPQSRGPSLLVKSNPFPNHPDTGGLSVLPREDSFMPLLG